jgi:thiol:disulfide interchange protein DsbA
MHAIRHIGSWLVVAMLTVFGIAAHAQITAGKEYLTITPPQPTPPGNNVEVLEFFWYGCPHCNDLQPALRAWLKKKPADVSFRSLPAAFDESWLQLARTFYAIDALGEHDRLHAEVFNAIHKDRKLSPRALAKDPKPLYEWVATQKVDSKKLADTYNSFSVVSKTNRTIDTTSAYAVTGTPSLAIDGRYITAPHMMQARSGGGVDYDQFFRNVDQLIAMARAQRKGK